MGNALEATLKDYKDTVERLEELLSNARSLKEVETEKQLRDEVSALKGQIQKLQEEKLASSAAAAAALPVEQPDPTTKIVHFLNNPLQQATEARAKEFDELKVENAALKARVQLLEEGQTKDLTLLVGQKMDEGASSEEVKELKNQLKSAETKKTTVDRGFQKDILRFS